jgi:hypothetical protein
MKKVLMALTFVSLITLLPACSGNLSIPLGSQFILQPGQAADIQGMDLSIKFVEISADSRCPQNVQCIVAGDVTARVIIKFSGESKTLSIIQSGEQAKTDFNGFELTTSVSPYPVAGREISPGDYRMTFTVRKL